YKRENNKEKFNQKCIECQGNLIFHNFHYICQQCGLIHDEFSFNLSNDIPRRKYIKNECSGNIKSSINKKNIKNFTINADLNRALNRAKRYNDFRDWDYKRKILAKTEINRISHLMDLPSYINENAFNLYQTLNKSNLLKRKSIKLIILACLYYYCCKYSIPRDIYEFLSVGGDISLKRFNSYYKIISSLENSSANYHDCLNLIPQYTSKLKLNYELENKIFDFTITYIKNKNISGLKLRGIIGGIIYFVCKLYNKKITQLKICEVLHVSHITLRNRFKEIKLFFTNKFLINDSKL
ncbi:MAG: hypothetical protein ACTSPW_10595, partial [Promethearchaeota archaeon]